MAAAPFKPKNWKTGTVKIDGVLHLAIAENDLIQNSKPNEKVRLVCVISELDQIDKLDRENAELIVNAVNSHEDLVRECNFALDFLRHVADEMPEIKNQVGFKNMEFRLLNVIKRARGQS